MIHEFLDLSVDDDGLATMVVNRPPVNALSSAVLHDIASALVELERDLPSALVVAGSGKGFSGGADIDEFRGPTEAAHIADAFALALDRLAAFPRVTVAAIHGFAMGGGFELALACDFRVMGASAKVALPEVQLGVMPGGGGTQRLPQLIGRQRALELLLSGRHVVSDEARALGLCDLVVPDDAVIEEASTFARSLGSGASVAKGMIKRAVNAAGTTDGFATERRLFSEVFSTRDAQEGIFSFREQGPGKATFRGR